VTYSVECCLRAHPNVKEACDIDSMSVVLQESNSNDSIGTQVLGLEAIEQQSSAGLFTFCNYSL